MHLLAGIEHNFPTEYAAGFTAMPRGKLFKIGLQMKERFWEREGIYGGISWTLQDIQQIWYPAHGIHRQKGVVLGAYTFDPNAGEKFARLPPAERIELAIQQGEKIHPGYGSHVESGVSIAWHQMNHMLGCAAQWDEALFKQWFKRLQAPVGSHYLIGDQVSYHPGWQEGAIASAHHAIADIDAARARGGNAGGPHEAAVAAFVVVAAVSALLAGVAARATNSTTACCATAPTATATTASARRRSPAWSPGTSRGSSRISRGHARHARRRCAGPRDAAGGRAVKEEGTLDAAVTFVATLESKRRRPTLSGDAARGKQLYATCAACHGAKGEGKRAEAPALAARSDWYLVTQLDNYRTGCAARDERDTHGAQMRAVAATLPDDKAIADVVAYINTLQ